MFFDWWFWFGDNGDRGPGFRAEIVLKAPGSASQTVYATAGVFSNIHDSLFEQSLHEQGSRHSRNTLSRTSTRRNFVGRRTGVFLEGARHDPSGIHDRLTLHG